ncbi:MAG: alpha-L-rhamnosidase N-terminal domain-containing protein, partial [Fermentimonas sp.]|nr:alpha-L-rhamnosidase N-terminal domain-containing protein [Fermentimonas sp.]
MKHFSLKCKINLLIILVTTIYIAGCSSDGVIYVQNLKCENLNNPLGINNLNPRFSWINISEQNGAYQTAYQILVATEIDKLTEDKQDYWDSKKVDSSESNLITYNGKKLISGQILYWKVRVWDESNKVSIWSEPAKFSIGLLEPNDWSALYIGFTDENKNEVNLSVNSDSGNENVNGFSLAPQFHKQFTVDNPDKKETFNLHVNSLGYHEVYLNGKKVSEDVLSPAVSQFNKRSLINTYDVTEYIKSGQNNLIVWLGSGWYTEGLPGVAGNGPAFKAQLEEVSGDNITDILVTDESWTARNSEYERISNWRSGRYGGETINGNLETRKIAIENPDQLKWNKVSLVDIPVHEVTPQMA